MTITEILTNTTLSDTDKLQGIASLVASIREVYGNSDVELEVPEVNTVNGVTPITFLTDEDKITLVERVIETILTDAYEDVQQAEGVVLDRRIEEYIAINPILSNLTTSNGSKYL